MSCESVLTPQAATEGSSVTKAYHTRLDWLTLERQFMLVLLALCMSLGIAYALVTEPFWGPDEDAHWDYVQLIWNTKGDPVAIANTPPLERSVRGHAPIYYWLVAGSYGLTLGQPLDVQFFAGRMVSLLLLLGEVVFAFLAARLLSPTRRLVYLGTPAIVALLPGRIWIGSVINNDNLASFASAALIYVTVRIIILGFSKLTAAALVITLLIAVGSKPTAWAVVAVSVATLALLALFRLRGMGKAGWYWAAALLLGSGIALSLGALLARGQLQRYWGKMHSLRARLHSIPPPEPDPFVHQWKSFWLPLWSADFLPPESVYWTGFFVILLAIAGLILRSIASVRYLSNKLLPSRKVVCVVMFVMVAIGVWMLSLLQHLTVVAGTGSFLVSRAEWPPTHGRYLFPALLPFAYLTTFGLDGAFPRRLWRAGLAALLLLFLYLNGVALYSMVAHNYWWSSS
jgi:hypothetical protein